MAIRGYPRMSMDIHGCPWISVGIHGCPRISMDVHGYSCRSIDEHRYPWISIDMHGSPWMSMDIRGIPWLSRNLFVTKWHTARVERISTRPTSITLSRACLCISRFSGCFFLFEDLQLCLILLFKNIASHPGPPTLSCANVPYLFAASRTAE